eukprot:TRINITY_DN10745_c0_g1_i4.p1 TRINITY_DN10745_c0_g1~~TRINITY_DN10745_c0_g1_i4.p1  ORF type:complete len:301 (-),score=24.23 TRINITY_DN10745_c0_g1_i4:144-1046(-)
MGLLSGSCFVVFILIVCIATLKNYPGKPWPSALSAITSSHFLTMGQLLIFRCFCLFVITLTNLYLFFDKSGIMVNATKKNCDVIRVRLVGYLRFTTFTVWSWCLQGVFFTLAITCQLVVLINSSVTSVTTIAEITCIVFEICFPIALLVSTVVTYVLIPSARNLNVPPGSEDPSKTFYTIPALLMHNANTFFMVLEFLFNRLDHFNFMHFPYPLLWGILYVIFAWIVVEKIEVFWYFFLNYNFPKLIPALLALLVTLFSFFVLGWVMREFLDVVNHVWIIPVILLATFSVCDLRHKPKKW